ncbi:chondroitinase family polysaccharide lyase, partial [Prolixibacteraceae bacterium]|nr:chondroitinase family polysaccharide lyase [Prolixibacteraceae bacterium]
PGVNLEAFNTTIMGRLASILMIENPKLRVQYLSCFVRYLNNGLDLAPGLRDAFKPDGSVFHHANNYPEYANEGYKNSSRMVYLLSRTGFAVSSKGHQNLKRSLLMTRLYCNKYVWTLSLSGQYPKGTGQILTEYYKYMALAGSPDGTQEIDQEMAGVFLRLVDDADSDPQAQYIVTKGGVAEAFPEGNWSMNYSALSIHRRDNWLVTAHGHSRYLWSSEHCPDANNFGRYLSYGALEVLASKSGSTPSNFTSGFRQWGWDWARIPGTTTIHLPIDSLQSKVNMLDKEAGKSEMLLSDEAFCGGLNFEKKYGVWAMNLHQNPKYDASFKARKSVFFFDDKIVCLGSDIQTENGLYPTETTLFQTHLKSEDMPIELNKKEVDKFPFLWSNDVNGRRDTYLKDNVGNFFYVPYKYNVVVERKHQISRDQSSKYRTENNFASAVINHGNGPSDAAYEYVMLVQPTDSEVKHFIKAMRYDDSHPYIVQQNDREAHIVEDYTSNVKGYAFFVRNRNVDDELVNVVDMPCLIMSKMDKKRLHLSLCDPDLHLYNGPADVQFDDNDNYVERSVYSRDWFNNESKESKIKITLNGDWALDGGSNCEVNRLSNGKTELIFKCQHGMTNEVRLKKN